MRLIQPRSQYWRLKLELLVKVKRQRDITVKACPGTRKTWQVELLHFLEGCWEVGASAELHRLTFNLNFQVQAAGNFKYKQSFLPGQTKLLVVY